MMNGAGSRHLFPRAVREGQEQGFRLTGGLGDDWREEIRKFFEEPERARTEFRAQSAITLAERGSPDWWLQQCAMH